MSDFSYADLMRQHVEEQNRRVKAEAECDALRTKLEYAERNAAQSQQESYELLTENQRLAKCCTQRGIRMQKIYEVLRAAMTGEHINVSEWQLIINWFDADGVPVNGGHGDE